MYKYSPLAIPYWLFPIGYSLLHSHCLLSIMYILAHFVFVVEGEWQTPAAMMFCFPERGDSVCAPACFDTK